MGARHRAKGTTFEASSRPDAATYAAHGGSFPIRVEGVGVIGAVTVSALRLQYHQRMVEDPGHFLTRP